MIDDAGNEKSDPVVLTPVAEPRRFGLRLRHIMMAVFLCAVVMWLWIQLQGGLIVAAILLAIPAAICTVVVLIRRNTAQQETILQALAIAAARSLPLAPAALAFADQFGRSFRSRVQRLAGLLDEGCPLPAALDQVPSLLSVEAQMLVRTGWETNSLARSLRDAAELRATRQAKSSTSMEQRTRPWAKRARRTDIPNRTMCATGRSATSLAMRITRRDWLSSAGR